MFYFFYIIILIHLIVVFQKSFVVLKKKHTRTNTKQPGFSVVVAAHNEAKNLSRLLPRLLKQDYPHFEIIIALDRCTDESLTVVKDHQNEKLRFVEINELPATVNGKKHALTQAIMTAKNEWILLTDADCYPLTSRWIFSFSRHILHETELLLGLSPYEKRPGLLNAFIEYETFQTALLYTSAALAGTPYMGVGRNLAYKKSLFIDNKGFEGYENITGGDDDLFVQRHATKKNTVVVLDPESLTYSAAKRTFREYLTQKTRHLSVGKYYRSKLKNSHIISLTIHLLVWVSFLYLAFNEQSGLGIMGIFGMLVIIKSLLFVKSASKMGIPFSVAWFPLVDFLYAVGVPLAGSRAVFVKNIKWN